MPACCRAWHDPVASLHATALLVHPLERLCDLSERPPLALLPCILHSPVAGQPHRQHWQESCRLCPCCASCSGAAVGSVQGCESGELLEASVKQAWCVSRMQACGAYGTAASCRSRCPSRCPSPASLCGSSPTASRPSSCSQVACALLCVWLALPQPACHPSRMVYPGAAHAAAAAQRCRQRLLPAAAVNAAHGHGMRRSGRQCVVCGGPGRGGRERLRPHQAVRVACGRRCREVAPARLRRCGLISASTTAGSATCIPGSTRAAGVLRALGDHEAPRV